MESDNPLVTVIVPMYNVEAYVGECIASLIGQTFGDFEAILVDDGSTDGTLERVRAAVGDDERFRIVVQERNQGQSAARNRALDMARGMYVVHLDADDYYIPEALEALVVHAQADDLDVLFFAAKTFYESRELRRSHPEAQDNRADIPGVLTGREIYVQFEETGAFRPSACMFMYRRQMVEDAGLRFEEGIIHEDLLFTMQIFPRAQRCAFLNECLYMRRMREGSTMTSERGMRNIHGLFTVARRLDAWYARNRDDLPQVFRDAFCRRLFNTYELAGRDVPAVDEDALLAYRDTLSPADRDAFTMHVLEFGRVLDEAYRSVFDSTTFKVGNALVAFPKWVKSWVVLPD